MPELPEVETVYRGILPVAEHSIIETIIIRIKKLRWIISPELYQIKNEKILKIQRRAKYLIFTLKNGYIIVHLGMSGILKVVKTGTELLKHDHIDMQLNNGYSLRYNDPRKFGCWLWTTQLDDFPLFAKLGPEPLTRSFNATYLYQKSQKHHQAIKNFIMQNPIVVGVGNIYASESLFLAKINPLIPANQLSKTQITKLVKVIKQVLLTAIKAGGTSLRDFIRPDGEPGYFAQQLYVYARAGQECLICGNIIQSVVIGQRNSFYCPYCQPIE